MRAPWRREKKVTWSMKLAAFLSRSRRIALFAGLVAFLGGAREVRRRTSHA